jgi:hypothetical protein
MNVKHAVPQENLSQGLAQQETGALLKHPIVSVVCKVRRNWLVPVNDESALLPKLLVERQAMRHLGPQLVKICRYVDDLVSRHVAGGACREDLSVSAQELTQPLAESHGAAAPRDRIQASGPQENTDVPVRGAHTLFQQPDWNLKSKDGLLKGLPKPFQNEWNVIAEGRRNRAKAAPDRLDKRLTALRRI